MQEEHRKWTLCQQPTLPEKKQTALRYEHKYIPSEDIRNCWGDLYLPPEEEKGDVRVYLLYAKVYYKSGVWIHLNGPMSNRPLCFTFYVLTFESWYSSNTLWECMAFASTASDA